MRKIKLNEKMQEVLDRLITVKEAVQITGISDPGIRRLIKDGRLPFLDLKTLIDPDDLDKIKWKKRGPKKKEREKG